MTIHIANPFSFDPASLQPQETPLACPACGAHTFTNGIKFERVVIANAPREAWPGGPRQQDRICRHCDHRWTAVLPPTMDAATERATVTWFKA